MLRLNLNVPVTAQPDRLGVLAGDLQGFPNGRRLTDDAVDIAVQAVEGAAQTGKLVDALAAGDKVDANDNAFGASFPYVALPNQGAVNSGRTGAAKGASNAQGSPQAAAPAADDDTSSPSLVPTSAEASSGMESSAILIGAVVGTGTLIAVLAAWWLRRRRATPAVLRNDDTVAL